MITTRICLVRHGETDWNVQRRIQGHLDVALNAAGRAQARALALQLRGERFAALYSSDLLRAHQTADALAHTLGCEPRSEPQLRERHYGRFQNLTHDEARNRHPECYRRLEARDPDHDFHGGESLHAFAQRVRHCLAQLATRHHGQQIVVVSHGGVLDIMRRVATAMDLRAPRDFAIPNAALNWLEFNGARWHLLCWGEQPAAGLDELHG
ncbi:MAG: histidine phosphatase family protein [Betaproteobacteria bacterium]|nr:histidine phosphatase family protein [Betaproteobacteria bacterium]